MRQLTNNIGPRLNKIVAGLGAIPSAAHKHFRSITPIDTGNARANTDLVGNEIQANYDYANALNTGWSRQAPSGMTGNTIEFIRDEIKKI